MAIAFNTQYTPREITDLAKAAYDAYALHADYKDHQGNSLPIWDDLSEVAQTSWRISIEKICSLTETWCSREVRVNIDIDFSQLKEDDQAEIIKQLKWRL